MAKKKASKKVGSRGPSVRKVRIPQPLGRGLTPPEALKQAPKTYAFRLEPVVQVNGRPIHAPIEVWGYQTETGWRGWHMKDRATQITPVDWPKAQWIEKPWIDATETARKVAAK